MASGLHNRWTKVGWKAIQAKLYFDETRFIVVHAPRRCGKSDLAKRKLVRSAMSARPRAEESNFLFSAPTHAQAKKIFWKDAQKLVPKAAKRGVSEVDKTIYLWNGASIIVCGMDVPERIEGIPLSGAILDEYGNMKEEVWDHLYPMFGDPSLPTPGWAWLTGVPEGRNHYYQKHKKGLDPSQKEWATYTWSADGILAPEVLKAARDDMDARMYAQEFGGEFVEFAGRAYYNFQAEIHAAELLQYDPNLPLVFAFDFNTKPGTATVLQEQEYRGTNIQVAKNITAIIDEVWIKENSNTPWVCQELIAKYQHHKGRVHIYGDATGGNRTTSQTDGNDYDLIQQYLCPVFGDRLEMFIAAKNPGVRSRINAVTARTLNADRIARLLVDPAKCPHTVEDFEGVRLVEGTTDKLDKETDKKLTHLTDGIGYYIFEKFPVFEAEHHQVSTTFY